MYLCRNIMRNEVSLEEIKRRKEVIDVRMHTKGKFGSNLRKNVGEILYFSMVNAAKVAFKYVEEEKIDKICEWSELHAIKLD